MDHEQKNKQKILETAKQEFAEYGLEGARVDRIAKKAEVNKAMIYYYFGSKEKLYQSTIRAHFERLAEFVDKQVTSNDQVEAILRQLAAFYDKTFNQDRLFIPILMREIAAGGERIKESFVQYFLKQNITQKLIALIDDEIQKGHFRNVDSRQAIISFIGMNIFYHVMAPIINPIWGIDDVETFRKQRTEAVVDLFVHGLKK